MKGSLVETLLWGGLSSHSVLVDVSIEAVDEIKSLISTLPGFKESEYRWPFLGSRDKFVSKEYLTDAFICIWKVDDEKLAVEFHMKI